MSGPTPIFTNAYDPTVLMLEDDSFVLLVSAEDQDAQGIWLQRYNADGSMFGQMVQLNHPGTGLTEGRQTQPEAVLLPDGTVRVIWRTPDEDTTAGDRGSFYRQDVQLTADPDNPAIVGPAEQVVSDIVPDWGESISIAALKDPGTGLENGATVTVWREYNDADASRSSVYAQVVDAGGNASPAFRVPDPVSNSQKEPEVLALSNGGFVVSWQANSGLWGSDAAGGIYGQMYAPDAENPGSFTALGGEFRINTDDAHIEQTQPRMVALEDGGFMVLWHHDGNPPELRFQKFDSAGALVGDEGVLQADGQLGTLSSSDENWTVIPLSGGGIAVAWQNTHADLYVQSFDLDGNALTAETLIPTENGTGGGYAFGVDLDQLSDGRLMVTWEAEQAQEIHTQTLDAPPAPAGVAGPKTLIPTAVKAYDPTVLMLEDDSFVLLVSAEDQDAQGIWLQRYNADGSMFGQMVQLNHPGTGLTEGRQTQPEAVLLPDGTVRVIWRTPDEDTTAGDRGSFYRQDVQLTADPDNPAIVGPAEQVVSDIVPDWGESISIAALKDPGTGLENGATVTVWREYNDADASRSSVYAQVVDAGGNASPAFRVPDPVSNSQKEPEVLALSNGGFVVSWQANSGLWGSDAAGGIYGQMYAPDAENPGSFTALGGEFRINTDDAHIEQTQPRMVALEDGGFMVLWHHDGNPPELRFQKFDSAGALVGDEGVLQADGQLGTLSSSDENWTVIPLSGGGIAVAWQNTHADLYVQSFDLDGNALTAETLIPTENGTGGGYAFGVDLDQLSDGRLMVTWEAEQAQEIHTQTLDAPPAPAGVAGPKTLIPTAVKAYDPTVLMLEDDSFVLLVSAEDQDAQGIWLQRYNADGSMFGQMVQLNHPGTGLTEGRQTQPEAVLLPDGTVRVIWRTPDEDTTAGDRGSFYRQDVQLTADPDNPAIVGPAEQVVSDIVPDWGESISIAALKDPGTGLENGATVTVWREYNDADASRSSVYAQVVDAGGNASPAFRVPDPVSNSQKEPEVLALSNGGFVVSWQANSGLWGSDAAGGIYGQMYAPDAENPGSFTALGGEFRINTDDAHIEQTQPRMVALEDGGFMVLWHHDGNPPELRFQKFDSAGALVGDEGVLQADGQLGTLSSSDENWTVIPLSGGGIAVAWQNTHADLYVQSFDLDGNALTAETLIPTENGTGGGYAFGVDLDQLSDGRLMVTWEAEQAQEIHTQTLDAPPAPAGVAGPKTLIPTAVKAYDPTVLMLEDDSFVLLVSAEDQDAQGIWLQRYNADGSMFGQMVQLNHPGTGLTEGRQTQPEAVLLPDGTVRVIWRTPDEDTTAGDRGSFYRQDVQLTADPDNPAIVGPAEQVVSDIVPDWGESISIAALKDPGTGLENGATVTVWREYNDADASRSSVYAQVVDAGGNASPAFRVPDPVSNSQKEPEVLALSNGGFVVSWQANSGLWGSDAAGGIYGQMYAPDAENPGSFTALGGEFRINTDDAHIEQTQPRMVALEDGGFMVLWHHDGNPPELRFQKFDSAGALVGDEGVLQADGQLGTLSSSDENWTVIPLSGGGIAVAWQNTHADLYVQSFDLDGNALTAETLIPTENGTGGGYAFGVDLDQLSDGRLMVTWEAEQAQEIHTQTLDAPPTSLVGDGPVELLPTILDAYDPSSAAQQDGGRTLVWASSDGDGTGIWGQRYDTVGNEVGPIFQINTTTADNQTSPEAVTLEDGSVLVTWMSGTSRTNGRGDIYAQRVNADGKLGDEIAVNPNSTAAYSKTADIAALEGGGYAIVWYEYHGSSSNRSVYLQQFEADGTPEIHTDAAGNPLTGPVRVPDPAYYNQTDPEILALNGGGYVVTWTATKGFSQGVVVSDSAGGIYGQIYDANGAPIASEFHVNTTTADDQEHSRMVALENGGFMVLWKHDGSPDQLRFQKFYGDGTSSGGEGILATGAAMTDMGAEWQAIALSSGGVAVAWHKRNGDLYVQSFDEAGNALTDVVTIETSNGANFISDLDQLSSGHLVVTWEESKGIYSQVLLSPPTVQDTVLSTGDDLFMGSAAGETILGLEGADTIYGGGGDDRLDGGNGDDILTGGSGEDTFVFGASTGTDTVNGFEAGVDLIEISSAGLPEGTNFTDLALADTGNNLQISFTDPSVATVIMLTGLSSMDVAETDIIFI